MLNTKNKMTLTLKQKKSQSGWVIILLLCISSIFLLSAYLYSSKLFKDLEQLMAQTRETRPSTIYSDFFEIHTGDFYPNTFLPERLNELKIPFQQTEQSLEWHSVGFNYPAALFTHSSIEKLKPNQNIKVEIQEKKISAIYIDSEKVDAIALEPIPIAQLSSANITSIRDYLKLTEIPTHLLQAIIAVEDQRFLEHPGFDIKSLARAFWINIKHHSLSQGGSTITQQLIKNLLGTYEKTLFRKAKELVLAILLDAEYSKEQILEKYLNEVYFGQIGALEVHGASEAARYFFNKPLSTLSLGEMALIAGVIRGPAYYSPYKHPDRAIDRKNSVLRKMLELKLISHTEYQKALHEPLSFARITLGSNRAPYFTDYVKAQVLEQLHDQITAEDLSNQGLRIFTTLDLVLQKHADIAVEESIAELNKSYHLKEGSQLEGVFVCAEPTTGFVRALVGGHSYAETTFNRVLNMKRQVGSTFKPIVYLAALLKGSDAQGNTYDPSYKIKDEPWAYEYNGKTWKPENYEKTFRGEITLREAFEHSINVPAAKIGLDVGLANIIETAKLLGIQTPIPEVPSITLGTIELSPMELLQAYSTIANYGQFTELTTVRAITDSDLQPITIARFEANSKQVIDRPYLETLHSLLQGVVERGTAQSLKGWGYFNPAFGKTGTTSYYRDAWFAGFSQGLVGISWVGYDQLKIPESNSQKKFSAPAHLTGSIAAIPIWARFFKSSKLLQQ